MRNKIIYILLIIFFIFVFVIFYRGLNNSNLYTPNTEKKIIQNLKLEIFIKKKFLIQKIFLIKISFIY